MSSVNYNLSLTPFKKMPSIERIGLTLIGLSTLAMLVAFLSASGPSMPFIFGGFLLVTGGVLLSRNVQKYKTLSALLFAGGLISLAFILFGSVNLPSIILTITTVGFLVAGGLIFIVNHYGQRPAGINNNGYYHSELTKNNGAAGWVFAIVLTGFYVLLYWFPAQLHGLIAAVDPLFQAWFGRSGLPANNGGNYNPWFLYSFLYTIAILVMAVRFMLKYRHNRYQQIRTLSVSFFQLALAFIIPNVLAAMNHQELYFHYFWPLDYDVLFPSNINFILGGGSIAHFFFWWSVVIAFIGVPILTYFYGKRWYCSWVCGCGGLAETAGDPFRHLSDKSLKAWQIERILVHGVLLVITVFTATLLINAQWPFLSEAAASGLTSSYGFAIGAVFSGVVGVGFYPVMGNRVWCRFGCPQAAILGILQKYFSRFRITTNGGQCISCGNCSTYCEMGIDVKWYAQREQNIVRASCVGCGICSAVCPRGVLKLENGPMNGKTAIHIDRDEVKVLDEDMQG